MKLRFAAFIPIAAILLSANAELTYTYKMTVESLDENYGRTFNYLCSFITSEFTNATETVVLSDLKIASITNLYTSENVWEYSGAPTAEDLLISSGGLSFAGTSRASWIYSGVGNDLGGVDLGVKIVPPSGYVSYGFLYASHPKTGPDVSNLVANTNKFTLSQIKGSGYPRYHIVPLIRPAREFWFVDPVANTTNVIAAADTEADGDDGPIGVKLPKPKAKRGYEFQYWETESGSSLQGKTYYNPQFVLGSVSTPVIVKASWTANSYTVKFNANGGSGSMADEAFTYDTAKALTANGFTRTGYTFQGWATSSGGAKVYNDKQSVSNLTSTADGTVNLYAKWTANSYTVKFNKNHADATGTMANESFTYDAAKALTANGFSRTGYAFAGWATSSGGTKAYNDGQSVSNLTATAGGTVNLYAKWTLNKYNLTLTPGAHITKIYYKINGATSWTAITAETTLQVDYGSTWYAYADAETGYEAYYPDSANPYTRTKGASAESTTFNAKAKKSTLAFDFTKGGGTPSTGKEATYDLAMPTPVNLPSSVTGWTFLGFYDAASGGTKYYNADGTGARAWDKDTTKGTTLYAQWTANVYTVTLHQGEGSGGTASVDATYDSAMPSIDTLPTRTGYTFEGYYTSTYGAGTRYYYATGSSAKKWDKTADTTLYANWSTNTYTVTLDKQGGSGGPDSVTATYNSELPTVTTPTRTGYTFGGYFTGENGGTQYYSSAGASVRNWTLTYNTTLYAKWTAKTSTVTFAQQDGSGGTASVDATYDRAMPSITIPTRTGYTFGGYFANTGGYGTQYYNADGTSTRTWDKTDTSITLYAKWTEKTYTVTLDQQGGSGGTESVTATYASSMPTATMPTRDGYAFGGYYTEANGGGDQYYRDNGTSAQAWYLTDDTTLYAKWGEITYTLRLLLNGGTGSSVSTNLTYDEEYTLPAVATLGYTKTGYRFNGWGDASDSTTALYADGATVSNLTSSANTTVNLYAIWGERTYTVTFDANGGEIDDGDSTREYTYNSTYGSLPVPSRTGYTFTGWKNGDNPITGDMTCVLADDATFTASWTPINYVIAFNANGGTGEMDAINAVYDEEVTLPASTFESPGELLGFAGWSESATAPETPDVEIAYADKAVVSNLVTEADATNTLYAVWRYPNINYALENFDLEFAIPSAYTGKVDVNPEDRFVEATNGGSFTTIITNAKGTLSFNWDAAGSGYVRIVPDGSTLKLKDYYPDAGEYAISLLTNIAVIVYWRADSGTDKTIEVSKVKWTPAGDKPTPAGDEPTDEDAPDISSLSVADGVKFKCDARFNYEIWYKTDLSPKTEWKRLKTIEGTGGEVGFDLIQPGEDVMFYEIKVVGK